MFFSLPARKIIVIVCCLNIFILSSIYLLSWWNNPPHYVFTHPYFLFDLDVREPRNLEQKCILPRLHPFHPSIWGYLKEQKKIVCKHRQPDLTFINREGRISFNQTEMQTSGYEAGISLFCYWSSVLRDGDDKVKYGDEVKIPADGFQLSQNISIIRVQCKNYVGFQVYEKIQGHIHVPKPIPETQRPKHHINVLIFGLDSMSRLSFIRHLPKTYRYLTEELNMTVLRGMNKVGDNTYPNLIPLLTGHKGYNDGLGDTSGPFDHWPLIWKNFSNSGYGTLWAEDMMKFTLFNYLAKGFVHPPTDRYIRPYWLAIDDSSLYRHSSYMCYGSYPRYSVQLDYVSRFVEAYEKVNRPYFGFSFLAELSHEYTTRISSADSDFEQFFTMLKNDGHLKNTILIVMSDHGHRFDSIRATQVGYIEERMPFYAIYIPSDVASLQPTAKETLQMNNARLVTPFDMYATLMDILHLATTDRPLGGIDSESERLGQTLFREVPLHRTCSDASIPDQYCICQTDTDISVNDPKAKLAATATVSNINELIKEGGLDTVCSTRTLKSITLAHMVETIDRDQENSGAKIRVMIETDPSGVFEALISINNGEAKVIGEVSRISPYASQSSCIQHVILRKFCFCSATQPSTTQ